MTKRATIDPEMTPGASLDLPADLRRIRYEGELAPRLDVLEALHEAQSSQIPVESLDKLLVVLAEIFGLAFAPGTRFKAVDLTPPG